MTESEIMEEIQRLTLAYMQHNDEAFFTSEHLKKAIVFDIYQQARTPQQVINYLHQKHGIIPYTNTPRHQVLLMNRTPWLLWLIQAFFIVITFPLSVPILMIWSWVNRGTPNFIRTDGSIYLEKVLALCQEVGITEPELRPSPTRIPPPESTGIIPDAPTIAQGVTMQSSAVTVRPSSHPLQALGGTTPSRAETVPFLEAQMPVLSTLPTAEEDVSGMANIAEAFTQAMVEHPAMFVESEVSRTNGKAVFIDAPQIERISTELRLQRFEYASAWTKPWRELDSFVSQITVFRQFGFVRRLFKTDKRPVNIVPSTSMVGRAYAFGLSFYCSDTKALIEKAEQDSGSGPTAFRFYQEALNAAKNNEEYTNAMESLINYYSAGIERFNTCHHAYASPAAQVRFRNTLELMADRLDEYIDQLPEDYYQCSSTARTLQTFFDEVWTHVERNELMEASRIFDQDKLLEKSDMEILIETPFVQRCLPHFVCMWHQLEGLLILKGYGRVLFAEDESECLQDCMKKALDCLQLHRLPEAAAFEANVVEPLHRMQTHIESIFQMVPRQLAKEHAVQRFRDCAEYSLRRISPSYRQGVRGQPLNRPLLFAEVKQNIVNRISPRDPSSTESRSSLTM